MEPGGTSNPHPAPHHLGLPPLRQEQAGICVGDACPLHRPAACDSATSPQQEAEEGSLHAVGPQEPSPGLCRWD